MTQFDHDFSYLIEKIERAQFKEEPFRRIYLEDFFSPEHFNAITASAEINTRPAQTGAELLNLRKKHGFRPIAFSPRYSKRSIDSLRQRALTARLLASLASISTRVFWMAGFKNIWMATRSVRIQIFVKKPPRSW